MQHGEGPAHGRQERPARVEGANWARALGGAGRPGPRAPLQRSPAVYPGTPRGGRAPMLMEPLILACLSLLALLALLLALLVCCAAGGDAAACKGEAADRRGGRGGRRWGAGGGWSREERLGPVCWAGDTAEDWALADWAVAAAELINRRRRRHARRGVQAERRSDHACATARCTHSLPDCMHACMQSSPPHLLHAATAAAALPKRPRLLGQTLAPLVCYLTAACRQVLCLSRRRQVLAGAATLSSSPAFCYAE